MAHWIPLFQGWWSKIYLQISIKLTPSVFSKSRPLCHHHLTFINFFCFAFIQVSSWCETCCPLFSKVSGSAPFPRVMPHWSFSKGWSILCTSLPFFKGLLLPKFLSKLFFAIALFSRGLLWMFPSWHPFSNVPQSRFHEMWRSLSSHAISVKVFVKLLYQLCFFGLPTYLEISTKNLLKKTSLLMPPKDWCHQRWVFPFSKVIPFHKGNSLFQRCCTWL